MKILLVVFVAVFVLLFIVCALETNSQRLGDWFTDVSGWTGRPGKGPEGCGSDRTGLEVIRNYVADYFYASPPPQMPGWNQYEELCSRAPRPNELPEGHPLHDPDWEDIFK